jgi:hypothetical protein
MEKLGKTKGQDLKRNETRKKRLIIPEMYGQVYHFHSLKHSSMSKSIVFNPFFLGITYNHQDLMFCLCAVTALQCCNPKVPGSNLSRIRNSDNNEWNQVFINLIISNFIWELNSNCCDSARKKPTFFEKYLLCTTPLNPYERLLSYGQIYIYDPMTVMRTLCELYENCMTIFHEVIVWQLKQIKITLPRLPYILKKLSTELTGPLV